MVLAEIDSSLSAETLTRNNSPIWVLSTLQSPKYLCQKLTLLAHSCLKLDKRSPSDKITPSPALSLSLCSLEPAFEIAYGVRHLAACEEIKEATTPSPSSPKIPIPPKTLNHEWKNVIE